MCHAKVGHHYAIGPEVAHMNLEPQEKPRKTCIIETVPNENRSVETIFN
jgi:hypothetical protein